MPPPPSPFYREHPSPIQSPSHWAGPRTCKRRGGGDSSSVIVIAELPPVAAHQGPGGPQRVCHFHLPHLRPGVIVPAQAGVLLRGIRLHLVRLRTLQQLVHLTGLIEAAGHTQTPVGLLVHHQGAVAVGAAAGAEAAQAAAHKHGAAEEHILAELRVGQARRGSDVHRAQGHHHPALAAHQVHVGVVAERVRAHDAVPHYLARIAHVQEAEGGQGGVVLDPATPRRDHRVHTLFKRVLVHRQPQPPPVVKRLVAGEKVASPHHPPGVRRYYRAQKAQEVAAVQDEVRVG
uniref:288R n=1 Tax=Porcine adenovirus A serotype 3 TaxID=35265 RepID=Q9IGT9_ADEP3|nr:288R [Porcine adenovirus 3]